MCRCVPRPGNLVLKLVLFISLDSVFGGAFAVRLGPAIGPSGPTVALPKAGFHMIPPEQNRERARTTYQLLTEGQREKRRAQKRRLYAQRRANEASIAARALAAADPAPRRGDAGGADPAVEAADRQQGDRDGVLALLRQQGVADLLRRVAWREAAAQADGMPPQRPVVPRVEPVDEPMADADAAEAVLDGLLRRSREILCRTADAPRVWSTDDERQSAGRIRDEMDAAVPTAMCAVCARQRPGGDVSSMAVGSVPSLHMLSTALEKTKTLPRDAKTTVSFDDLGSFCLHPDGERTVANVCSVARLQTTATDTHADRRYPCIRRRCKRRGRRRVFRMLAVPGSHGNAPGQPCASGHGPLAR